MAAGDGNAGLGANRGAAFQNLGDLFRCELVDRHAENGER